MLCDFLLAPQDTEQTYIYTPKCFESNRCQLVESLPKKYSQKTYWDKRSGISP